MKTDRAVLGIIDGAYLMLLLLFPLLSLLPPPLFFSEDARHSLILTGVINIITFPVFYGLKRLRRDSPGRGELNRGMGLFILYNAIPPFFLISSLPFRLFCAIIIILVFAGIARTPVPPCPPRGREGLFRGVILLFFSLLFIGRGIQNVFLFYRKQTDLTSLSVSLADLTVCSVWLFRGLGSLLPGRGRDISLLPVFFQAVLLFATLLAYLALSPLLGWAIWDPWGFLLIFVMGLFFFFPLQGLIGRPEP